MAKRRKAVLKVSGSFIGGSITINGVTHQLVGGSFSRVGYDDGAIRVNGTLVRKCRVCGCTDDDCRQCIEKTGSPCHWVEKDLCSACVEAD